MSSWQRHSSLKPFWPQPHGHQTLLLPGASRLLIGNILFPTGDPVQALASFTGRLYGSEILEISRNKNVYLFAVESILRRWGGGD